jgi:predicted restriction endonuclease
MNSNTGLADYVRRFRNLNPGGPRDQPRPHKPCMLLAVLSLAENGRLTENEIYPDAELVELFRAYFEATSQGNDRCTPENPFFYLKSEGFWRLHAPAGSQSSLDAMSAPGSWAAIVRSVGRYCCRNSRN